MLQDPTIRINKALQGFDVLVVDIFNIIGTKMTLFHDLIN